jgi:hypothetical protein
MLYIVEVRHIGTDLAVARAELQAWLHSHRIKPVEFEHSTGGPGITFRVHFAAEKDASAFSDIFHGWLNNGRDGHEGRWAACLSQKPDAWRDSSPA